MVRLSDREYQVLCLLASGLGIKEIAGQLGLSPPTVATYRARVMTKLDLATTVDLVRYALANNLIEQDRESSTDMADVVKDKIIQRTLLRAG